MKILIVNIYDVEGGAARAAYRLHKALLAADVQSNMLVQRKLTDDYSVQGPVSKKQKIISMIKYYVDQIPVFFYKERSANLFSPAWFSSGDILKQINQAQPDIVHLHWICKGLLSVEDIGKIKAPIVWTLHDSWAFTGGCHIPGECKNYINGCGSCESLGSKKIHDLSEKVYMRKQKTYALMGNITVIAVSNWLKDSAKNSALFKNSNVIRIANAIDTKLFAPVNKSTARSILNITEGNRVVLFGAMSATSDLNKGYRELIEAINKLSSTNIEIVIFGSRQPQIVPNLKYKMHYVGRLHDDISLKVVYSAADVMVVPSLMEAFGQTATEAMACGTPVVAFQTTGLLDIVDHKINGYLAKAFDTTDLARGIEWVLSTKSYGQLAQNARDKVIREFDSEVIATKYIALYRQVLHSEIQASV